MTFLQIEKIYIQSLETDSDFLNTFKGSKQVNIFSARLQIDAWHTGQKGKKNQSV